MPENKHEPHLLNLKMLGPNMPEQENAPHLLTSSYPSAWHHVPQMLRNNFRINAGAELYNLYPHRVQKGNAKILQPSYMSPVVFFLCT